MISILVAIGLGLLTLAFVLYPLYHRTSPSEQVLITSKGSEDSSVLPSEREQERIGLALTGIERTDIGIEIQVLEKENLGDCQRPFLCIWLM